MKWCQAVRGCQVRKQKGVVLILAMLIVVLVSSIAIGLSWRYNLSLTRAENRWHGMQARAYLEGAEVLAAVVLQEDERLDQEDGRLVDSLDEFWAQPSDPFPTDHGWVQGSIEDAQGRFNLNLLDNPGQNPQTGNNQGNQPITQRFSTSQKRFIRLLQTFEFEDGPIDQARAIEITEAVIDWIDKDQNVTGFGGAEKDYYQQLDPPVTPPDQPMVSVSELRSIKGITPELYQALLPLVIALPANVPMNINTMPLALMRTMAGKDDMAPLTEEDAQLLLDARAAGGVPQQPGAQQVPGGAQQNQTPGGFASVQDFQNSPELTALTGSTGGLEADGLAVRSNYFLLFSEALVGEQTRSAASLLKRENGQTKVIRRTDAHF